MKKDESLEVMPKFCEDCPYWTTNYVSIGWTNLTWPECGDADFHPDDDACPRHDEYQELVDELEADEEAGDDE